MKNLSITVYSLSTCSACKALIKWLEGVGVRFGAVDVDLLEKDKKAEIMNTVKQLTPIAAFPTSVIGGKVIVGFKEKAILKALHSGTTSKTHPLKKIFLKLLGA